MALKNSLFALVFLIASGSAGATLADTWTVAPEQSSLGFEVKQGEAMLKGQFTDWNAEIDFDPQAPENAKISATINPASASTGNAQFDGTLPGADWFDASAFPDAAFTAEGATLVEGNSYRTQGTLTIKGISHPATLDFVLEIEGDTATAKGTATVDRLAYQLGAGVGADTVGDAVTVTLDLTARR